MASPNTPSSTCVAPCFAYFFTENSASNFARGGEIMGGIEHMANTWANTSNMGANMGASSHANSHANSHATSHANSHTTIV